jgi:hypothetical protein
MSGKTSRNYAKQYTKPELRERLKEKIKKSDKGGRKGQWSARKSQLLAAEYKKEGGGFKGRKQESQKDLERWTDESWQTKSGKSRARHGKTTERYLPKEAWDKLSPDERRATDRKKRVGSRKGRQFVANTPAAKRARRSAAKSKAGARPRSGGKVGRS